MKDNEITPVYWVWGSDIQQGFHKESTLYFIYVQTITVWLGNQHANILNGNTN